MGNNHSLHYLWIKNCPHLTTLRYAHCGLKHDAWIDNCPNLTIIKNHNWNGGIEWGNPDQDNHQKQAEFKRELKQGLEDKPDQQIQILAQIILLFEQAEFALKQKDYPKLEQIIQQMKELVQQVTNPSEAGRIQAKINRFEQELLVQTTTKENYWPWVIGCLGVSLVIVSLMFLFINKWVATQVKKPMNSTKIKKKK